MRGPSYTHKLRQGTPLQTFALKMSLHGAHRTQYVFWMEMVVHVLGAPDRGGSGDAAQGAYLEVGGRESVLDEIRFGMRRWAKDAG